jgi:alkyldihydroxyacetonephosphate synthase
VCGGAIPLHGGVTIDLKRMDRLLSVEDVDLACDVEAGMNGERLERELQQGGHTLGHFPSSIYCSTVGGWLAARSAGQMSTKYGKIEDMVRGVTAVTGRGEVITTGLHGRAGAGPDWTQLLVGSEGTLAVIARARLAIRPLPEVRFLRGFEFPRITSGLEGIRRVLQRGLRPAVVRLYDPFESFFHFRRGDDVPSRDGARAAAAALPSLEAPAEDEGDDGLLARLRALVPGAQSGRRLGRELFAAALDRPRMLNALAETFGEKVSRRGCLLIAGVEGARPRTEVEAGIVFRELERAGGRDLGEQPGQRWYAHRYAVSYRMSKVFEAGAFVDTMEVAATWERLLDLYEGVRRAIGKHAFVGAHFSHAYPEGCSIYFTFVAHAGRRADAERKYDVIWKDGLEATTRAGGTISHHHGVGLMKGPYMAEEHRESMAIFRALKRTLDPDAILNPGKMGLDIPEGQPWATITRS